MRPQRHVTTTPQPTAVPPLRPQHPCDETKGYGRAGISSTQDGRLAGWFYLVTSGPC